MTAMTDREVAQLGIAAMTTEDIVKELHERVQALAAEVDRMRPVVEAAQVLTRSLRRHDPASWSGTEEALERRGGGI